MRAPAVLKNIVRDELIGLECEVVESRVKSQVGLKGVIIDETRNTLVLETEKGDRTILKKDVVLAVRKSGLRIIIPGKEIIGRPEDRIKKKVRW